MAILLPFAALAQPSPALHLEVRGGPVPAIQGNSACDSEDIPDIPARALHLADGKVELYAGNQRNRVERGADLLHVKHDCTVVMTGAGSDDPAAYNDRAWIASPWTPDGTTIFAVVHNEFHGQLRPALCPTRRYMDCWFNALTAAVSRDGGRSFQRAPGHARRRRLLCHQPRPRALVPPGAADPAIGLGAWTCADPPPIFYFSLLDPASTHGPELRNRGR